MSIAKKLTRAEELRAERDRLDEQIVLAEHAEREAKRMMHEPERGARIMIEATFPRSRHSSTLAPQKYTYLAMRVGEREPGSNWYVTGQSGKVTWSRIIELVKHADKVEIFDLDFQR